MTSKSPQWAYAAALSAMPLQTPLRLRRLIASGEPSEIWSAIIHNERPLVGISDAVWRAWASVRPSLVHEMEDACGQYSISVMTRNDSAYPRVLVHDAHAPAVLFVKGDISCLSNRRVGIIGTRTATQRGRFVAKRLGAELSAAGVCVVSGLARGIDIHSHIGAMEVRQQGGIGPAGVVASGLNCVYPPEHAAMWHRISEEGVLLSEAPPNTAPETHRFPLRNRVLAALSEVLLVVESRNSGGSMITVREAMKRDIAVMAVPGPLDVVSCEGTNALLRDGCAPVLDVDDVLVALGLDTRREQRAVEFREPPTNEELLLLNSMGNLPRTIDEMSLLVGATVIDIAVMLGRLESKEWVSHSNGWWEALSY